MGERHGPAPVVGVTDDPRRLSIWAHRAGLELAPSVDLTLGGDSRRALRELSGHETLAVVLAAPSDRWERMLTRPLQRAARARLVVCGGLRGGAPFDDVLAVAARGGLQPHSVSRFELDGLEAVEVDLGREAPAGGSLARVMAALQIAEASAERAAPLATGPRVAIHGDAGQWVAGLAHASAVDGRWADDARVLRRAAPDAVLVGPGGDVAPEHLAAVDAAAEWGTVVLAAGRTPGEWQARARALVPDGPCPIDPATIDPARREAPLVDLGPSDLPEDPGEAATAIVRRCAAGEPLRAPDLPAEVAQRLDPRLRALLIDPGDLGTQAGDPLNAQGDDGAALGDVLRQRHGTRLRRAALSAYAVDEWWRKHADRLGFACAPRRTVTALCVTRRPGFLPHLSEQLARQTYRPFAVVLVLHGAAWDGIDPVLPGVEVPVEVVRAPEEASLGSALRRGSAAAGGTIITKMDDDDWYGPDHVADLARALETRRCVIAGKGAEFYYLGELDRTIRRMNDRAEQPSPMIAGSTLTIRADDLAAVGGWRDVDRTEDRWLVHNVQRWGGVVYRTHGFGHVVQRHDHGHTWSVAAEDLTRAAVWEAAGLRLDVADC